MPNRRQRSRTQVGTLSCRVDPNIGFIIIGHQPMQCVYTQAPGAVPQVPPQSSDGALSTVGVALGVSTGSVLGWAVFAPPRGCPRWRTRRRVPRRFGRCGSRSGRRCERAARRIEPHDSPAAALASGIDRDQRDRRCVIAQAALALNGRSARSTPVQGDRGFDDLTSAV